MHAYECTYHKVLIAPMVHSNKVLVDIASLGKLLSEGISFFTRSNRSPFGKPINQKLLLKVIEERLRLRRNRLWYCRLFGCEQITYELSRGQLQQERRGCANGKERCYSTVHSEFST